MEGVDEGKYDHFVGIYRAVAADQWRGKRREGEQRTLVPEAFSLHSGREEGAIRGDQAGSERDARDAYSSSERDDKRRARAWGT